MNASSPIAALSLVLVTALASFYMDRYAIYFDREMLRNVLGEGAAR